jgi:hypothetical protein
VQSRITTPHLETHQRERIIKLLFSHVEQIFVSHVFVLSGVAKKPEQEMAANIQNMSTLVFENVAVRKSGITPERR